MGKIKLLTREQVLGARVQEKVIEVPQWGGSVRIRELTKQKELLLRSVARTADGQRDEAEFEKQLFLQSVVEPQFTGEDYELLKQQAAAPLNLIVTEIIKLNFGGLEPAKAFEERERQFFPGNQ